MPTASAVHRPLDGGEGCGTTARGTANEGQCDGAGGRYRGGIVSAQACGVSSQPAARRREQCGGNARRLGKVKQEQAGEAG